MTKHRNLCLYCRMASSTSLGIVGWSKLVLSLVTVMAECNESILQFIGALTELPLLFQRMMILKNSYQNSQSRTGAKTTCKQPRDQSKTLALGVNACVEDGWEGNKQKAKKLEIPFPVLDIVNHSDA